MEKVKMCLAVCVLMVIAICAGIVLAGDVVIKEGTITTAGSDASGVGEDACDVVVVTGGTGGGFGEGGKGADILLTSGAGGGYDLDEATIGGDGGDIILTTGKGGNAVMGDGGDGGDIELTTSQGGTEGDFGEAGDYGNIILAKNGGFVGIGTTNPARPLHISDVLRIEPRSSAPSSPSEGDLYVNSSNHHIYCRLNGSWKQLD